MQPVDLPTLGVHLRHACVHAIIFPKILFNNYYLFLLPLRVAQPINNVGRWCNSHSNMFVLRIIPSHRCNFLIAFQHQPWFYHFWIFNLIMFFLLDAIPSSIGFKRLDAWWQKWSQEQLVNNRQKELKFLYLHPLIKFDYTFIYMNTAKYLIKTSTWLWIDSYQWLRIFGAFFWGSFFLAKEAWDWNLNWDKNKEREKNVENNIFLHTLLEGMEQLY